MTDQEQVNNEWSHKQIGYLLDGLRHQSENGGIGASNKWYKSAWENYCKRVKAELLNYGYPEQVADQAIAKATEKVKLID